MSKHLLIFLLFATGCGISQSSVEPPLTPESPVDVRVDRAFYQGDGLHVKVRVTSKTELPTADIVVNITGLDEGQVIESYEQRLSEVFPLDELDVGEAALLDFVLKNPELSEYQVQCRWGEEAHKPIAVASDAPDLPATEPVESARAALAVPEQANAPAAPEIVAKQEAPQETKGIEVPLIPTGGDLVLKLSELEKREVTCDQPPCDRYYTIRATLLNQSASPIGGIVLASGLQWVNDGATMNPPEPFSKVLEGESVVGLEGFVLQPSKEKKLKVAVDRAVPTVPGGQFVPYLRLVASGAVGESPPQAAQE